MWTTVTMATCQLLSTRILQIKAQVPNALVPQSQLYSGYKSPTTLKALLGCDPNGYVVFYFRIVYWLYISDKTICEQSGFFQLFKDLLENSL